MTWQFRATTFSCRSSPPVRYQMLSYCFSVRRRTPTVPVPSECSDNRRMCFSAVFRLEVIRIYSSVPIRRYPSETRKLRRSVYAFFCSAFVRGVKHYQNSHSCLPFVYSFIPSITFTGRRVGSISSVSLPAIIRVLILLTISSIPD